VRSAFERGDIPLERLASWVFSASVLVALVFAESFLDVGGRGVNRRHDGAGKKVGSLSGMNCARAESVLEIFVEDAGHSSGCGGCSER
jgi:hypothetical protein